MVAFKWTNIKGGSFVFFKLVRRRRLYSSTFRQWSVQSEVTDRVGAWYDVVDVIHKDDRNDPLNYFRRKPRLLYYR